MSKYLKVEDLFVSGNNIRFQRRDMKNRSEVRVINDSCDFVLHTYRFNNVRADYDMKYMNWANINCCGGWVLDKDYLSHAVQNDSKLYAGIYDVDLSSLNIDDSLIYGDEEYGNNKFICKKGCVADYIDVNRVFDAYDKFGIKLYEPTKNYILEMCKEDIFKYSSKNNKFNFDYANPLSICEFIFNGMLLGYPIETTVWILER